MYDNPLIELLLASLDEQGRPGDGDGGGACSRGLADQLAYIRLACRATQPAAMPAISFFCSNKSLSQRSVELEKAMEGLVRGGDGWRWCAVFAQCLTTLK